MFNTSLEQQVTNRQAAKIREAYHDHIRGAQTAVARGDQKSAKYRNAVADGLVQALQLITDQNNTI
jgi:hypothetical protein